MMEKSLSISSTIPDPLPRHYPAVYWFWHRNPSSQEIEKQLTDIKQAGYRTFLIQPRLAFSRHEYLGENYLNACRFAMQTADKLDLVAGLYDDYNWISGHAGGRTVAGHDKLRERQLFWSQAVPEQGKAICSISGIQNRMGDGLGAAFQNWIYEGGQATWGGWQVVRAYLCQDNTPPEDVTAHCQVTDGVPDGCRVQVVLPGQPENDSSVVVFVSAWCTTSRLVNMLHPAAADRFIEAGYEPYRQTIGEYFGSTLKFLFFDQPYTGFYTWNEHFGSVLNSLMFDESLLDTFQVQRGYDPGLAFLTLVQKESADSPRLRCDFFETYGGLARSRFLEPLSAWAHSHGLMFAGHELLGYVGGWGFSEGLTGIDARVNFGADYFAIDACKDISSVDACNYHPQISARFGASLAKAHDRRGCIVEQYSVPVGRGFPAPAGQWGLSLAELRSQAIRHLLYGASTFLFHAYYQTIGNGDEVEPMINPRFDFPPGINFEPWFRFHPQFAEELARLNLFLENIQPQTRIALLYPLRAAWHDGPAGSYNAESAFWNRWLSRHGFDFDIIDERQGDADDLRQKGYRLLILPGVSVVKNCDFEVQVEKFVENGGYLAVSGDLPSAVQETGADLELQRRFQTLINNCTRVICFSSHTDAENDGGLQNWMAALQDGITVQPLDGSAASLTIRQGSINDDPAIALFNDSDEHRKIGLSIPQSDWVNRMPERWFVDTGGYQKWACFERLHETMQVNLEINPFELACFRFVRVPGRKSDKDTLRIAGESALQKTRRIVREDPPHVCWLDGQTVMESSRIKDDGSTEVTLRSDQKGAARMLVHSTRQPEIDRTTFVRNIHFVKHNLWMVELEIPDLPQPLVLGENWTLRTPHQYKAVPVDLQQGWEKDYPYYSGSGYYSISFHLGEDGRNFRWELQCPEVHSALSVYLNQAWLGARGWPPYHLMLPVETLKLAYNQLRIAVWNTAGNSYYQNTPYQPEKPFPAGLSKEPVLCPFVRVKITLR